MERNARSLLGISFVSFPGSSTIEVIDPVERHRFQLDAKRDVTLEKGDPEVFMFPVDEAVKICTDRLILPLVVSVYVRTSDGDLVAEAKHNSEESLPERSYIIELCGPIKTYIEVESAISISSGKDRMSFDFGNTVCMSIGARSAHERPNGRIITTQSPEDMMRAISSFGSALKTTSPERTFPTLRGHPPEVILGDELSIPNQLKPPDTGITIEVKPIYEQVFGVASLAYFLGATVQPGKHPVLKTDSGFEYSLDNGSFSSTVEEVLKQTFLLDSVTRTDGLYKVNLKERKSLESILDLDFPELYDLPLADRISEYLDIPFTLIADEVPEWGVGAHMLPDASVIEVLPYLVDDLALVHVHDSNSIERPKVSTTVSGVQSRGDEVFVRSASDAVPKPTEFIKPPRANSVEQVWVGDGTPIGASKVIPEAYVNRLDRTPSTTDIGITVICNDAAMNEEQDITNDVYGSRDDLDLDLSIYRDLTRNELSEVLTERTDFLHYIGHIDDEGFECADGKLDIASVDSVGVAAFLLNACQSYHQGRHLIEGGATGGIVTLSEVINTGAIRMGANLAQLLNIGFPLYAALDIAKTESLMGSRYIVVGDGRVALTQSQSVPAVFEIDRKNGLFEFMYMTYPTSRIDLGSMTVPYIASNDQYVLISQRMQDISSTQEEILEFLHLENMPVRLDGELEWSQEIETL